MEIEESRQYLACEAQKLAEGFLVAPPLSQLRGGGGWRERERERERERKRESPLCSK